jgi:ComF family protein
MIWQPALRAGLSRLAAAGLNLLLPPHCPCCDEDVPVQGTFCVSCFAKLNFITEPLCHSCGLPFASRDQAGQTRTCVTCNESPPLWREARAALVYDDAARNLILPFKHANRQEIATVLAAQMARAGRSLLAQTDLIVPVPLHRWRLFRRGFNQAALLSLALAKRTRLRAMPDALQRTRRTPVLGPLSATQRAQTLQGAFIARPKRSAILENKHILLVDDVMTSGATANACAEALLKAGCAGVDVLVAARVPDPRGR